MKSALWNIYSLKPFENEIKNTEEILFYKGSQSVDAWKTARKLF